MSRCIHILLCIVAVILLPQLTYAQPVAGFTSNTVAGCSPILVQFTDQSTGNPTSWNWNLGNGTTSTVQNPSTIYISPGTYTVTLTVSNASGSDVETITNYITVTPVPFANFVVSDSTLSCPPKTVQFTNLSIPGSSGTTSYLWDFGDGTTSTTASPSHTYTTGGNYSVTLSVINSAGCQKIKIKNSYVLVSQKPDADFTATNNNSCSLPTTVNFTNITTGATSYLWNFGNGVTSTLTNPTCTYATGGSYTVTLIATNANGCKDTIIKPNFVNIGPLVASYTKSATTLCIGEAVNFTNTTTPGVGNSTWYFGDGTSLNAVNASKAYSAAGTYTVKLVVQYSNCSDSTTQTVVVQPAPNIQFTANPANWCAAPINVQFTNNTTGAVSYQWSFGTGATSTATNPAYTYNALGTYTVSLIATSSNGCKDTVVQPSFINLAQPNVNIIQNNANICAPATVGFSTTLTPNQPVTSYVWNFGDATSATTSNPTIGHLYNNYGNYNVTVNVTTASGCTATDTLHMPVGSPVNASFSASPLVLCPGQTVNFMNMTSSTMGSPLFYWDFGDGTADNLTVSPSHTYSNQGVFLVIMTALNNGCPTVDTQTIIVNPPLANFYPNYFCDNRKKVTFTNLSVGGTSISWDFGDTTALSTQTNPTHTYNYYGIHYVKLTVVNGPSGCVATHIVPIYLFPLDAQFSANDTFVCKKQPVSFTAQPAPDIVKYIWNFGDGITDSSSSPNIQHAYTSSGIFTVRLIVRDIRGCKDTLIRQNYMVVNGPNVNFVGVPVSGCAPLNVNFTDQSTSLHGFASRVWRFGDGITANSSGPAISHVYSPGIFNVRLIVTDTLGCKDTVVKNNYITSSMPVANFTVNDSVVCKGEQVTFTNNSSTGVASHQWLFGDGTTSSVVNPTHIYTNPGIYTVTLIITSNAGCKDTMIRTSYITVNGVHLGFVMSDSIAACPPLTVNFTDTSTGSTNIWWSFGNGNVSNLTNASTVYSAVDTYAVKLFNEQGGCIDSAVKTVVVLGPTGTLSYTPQSGCMPLTVHFTSTNTNTQVLIWDMNNGVTQTTPATSGTSYTYTQPGLYIPILLLSDGLSCIVPVLGADTIKVGNLVTDFTYAPTNVCQSGVVNFTDTILASIAPVASRQWNFGDGGTSTAHNPSHLYNAPGVYTVTYMATSANGCIDTVIKTVQIFAPPVVSAGSGVNICQGQTSPAQLQATGAASYTWSPAATLSCSNCANPLASPVGTTTYTVIGIAANGCADTSQVTVTVQPLPTIITGANPSICAGSSVQLAASGGVSYSWSPATGLSCTSCNNPTAAPATTITYTVTGTNALGCSNTAQVTVNVNALPTVNASANNTSICAGGNVQLQATGATSYTWTPTTGLSCTNCASPTANPTTTTTYIVEGVSSTGCVDTGAVTITVNNIPAVNAGNNQSICTGGSAQLQASGAATYTWSPATGLSCTNCTSPVANPSATTTYTVTGTSSTGCVSTSQVMVTVNALPQVSAGNNQTICSGTAAQLSASGASTYSWTPATTLSCSNCASPMASPTATTVYTVAGVDANGCSNTAEVTVSVQSLPTVNAGPDVAICKLANVQLQASGAVTYTWTPATTLSCNTCSNPVASPASATTYTVTGTDANGCSNTDNVTVNLHPDANVNAGADETICFGASVQLQATGGQTYNWSPSSYLSCTACADPMAAPLTSSSYMVTGVDVNGCVDSDRIVITVIEKKPISFGNDADLCEGQSASLFANGGDAYQWIPATGLTNANIANPVATPLVSTDYKVIIKQGNCFSDTGVVHITVHPMPTVNAGGDQTIIAGTTVNLFAITSHTSNYQWTPSEELSCGNCQSPVALPSQTTTYTVFVSNEFGCEAKDDVTIFVKCDESQVFMANTFTPNGDGANDRYYPQGKGLRSIQQFRIFNRWGEVVYDIRNIQPNDEMKGWDGTYKGEMLNPDVYVYVVDALCETGAPIQVKGDISLIR